MKLVKNLVFAVLLMSAMAVNTSAGEQDTPGYVPPPPPRATSSYDEDPIVSDSYTEQTGDITADTSDYFLYEALAALLSVY